MWTRRTGDGHPTTASRHHPGTMKNVTKDLRSAAERAGTRPGTLSPDPSLALMTSMGMRRTGGGDPVMGCLHATGTMKNVTKDLNLGPVTPGPSLALLTTMGMRRTGDGHPVTGPLHAFGVPEMMEDLRSVLERAGTRRRCHPALTALPGVNSPMRGSSYPGPLPTRQGECLCPWWGTRGQALWPGTAKEGDAALELAQGQGVALEIPSSLNPISCICLCSCRERGGFQDHCKPWGFHGPARRHCQRLHRGPQKLAMVLRPLCARPRGVCLTLCSAPAPHRSASAAWAERGVAPVVFLTPQGIAHPLSPLPAP
ncbi:uncharacterized protein LOC133217349 [Neopsephotus bourkii]|uniref:uncharacterized protein LOC133217349 n=1 Tax=Neopsephotus bourkii TaxID=309878 RepID=UPI002AA54831|nr:uncharacterized protein LOC133217349 [Neopsephotus bourkii]